MKVEFCIILKLLLNFIDSEPQYSYELYSYNRKSISSFLIVLQHNSLFRINSGILNTSTEAAANTNMVYLQIQTLYLTIVTLTYTS